jgi:diguanylate cyclase (GGDEF)-like protein
MWPLTIDEPTLMTVLGLASITASAMFLALSSFARSMPGVRLWAWGCMAVGLATIIDGPRLVGDWRAASLLFNIPFTIGQALFLAGTMQFCGRPGALRFLSSLSLAAIALTVLFTLVLPDTILRIGTLSLLQAGINLRTAQLLWRHPDKLARRAYCVAGAASLFQAAAALAQGYLVAFSGLDITYAAPQLPLANIISWAGALMNILVGNWTLFLLIMLRLVADLRTVAAHDALTGLLNRRGLRFHIDSVLRRADDAGALGVLLLDIDHFKAINDTHGHDTGDQVLAVMGQVLRDMKQPGAMPCRWGGEEFCIVLEGPTPAAARALAERVRRHFRRQSGDATKLAGGASVSVGIAIMNLGTGFEMSKLIAAADAQLYRAKENGRDQVACAPRLAPGVLAPA